MNIVEIINYANLIELRFNDLASAFQGQNSVIIEKGVGNRIYLSENKTMIDIVFSGDGDKIQWLNVHTAFNTIMNADGIVPFVSMEELYARFLLCLNDRTGNVIA